MAHSSKHIVSGVADWRLFRYGRSLIQRSTKPFFPVTIPGQGISSLPAIFAVDALESFCLAGLAQPFFPMLILEFALSVHRSQFRFRLTPIPDLIEGTASRLARPILLDEKVTVLSAFLLWSAPIRGEIRQLRTPVLRFSSDAAMDGLNLFAHVKDRYATINRHPGPAPNHDIGIILEKNEIEAQAEGMTSSCRQWDLRQSHAANATQRCDSTFHHNLFACNTGRNPSMGMSGEFDYRNNVIFNWAHRTMDGGDETSLINVINNYYKPGPATRPDMRSTIARIEQRNLYSPGRSFEAGNWYPRTQARPGKWYVAGNIVEGSPDVTATRSSAKMRSRS